MLYFIYGKDFEKRKAKRKSLLEALQKKRPGAEVFEIDPDGFEESSLDELLFSQGLFERKFVVLGKGFFTAEETKDIFLKKLSDIAESPNVFLFEESGILKTVVKKIEKHAEKVFDVGEGVVSRKEEKFNMFALADALGRKDKKQLWVLFTKAVRAGVKPEEIHGMLFWQVRALLAADRSNTAEEAGLKPFPFQKAREFSRNYSSQELRALSWNLVSIYHDAHRGKFDLTTELERFVLGL